MCVIGEGVHLPIYGISTDISFKLLNLYISRHRYTWSPVWLSSSGKRYSIGLKIFWNIPFLQRVTDTEGLELLVVTNTIPQVFPFCDLWKYNFPYHWNIHFSKSGWKAGEVRQAEGDRRDANFCRGAQVLIKTMSPNQPK